MAIRIERGSLGAFALGPDSMGRSSAPRNADGSCPPGFTLVGTDLCDDPRGDCSVCLGPRLQPDVHWNVPLTLLRPAPSNASNSIWAQTVLGVPVVAVGLGAVFLYLVARKG
jgi:hypothetical protein